MTDRKHLTCPETGHLEAVELERTPLGLVVTGCSRARDGSLACPRECARRLDRRDRMGVEDRERVLVVLANLHDDAARIATVLAEELAVDGFLVELAELRGRPAPPPADYDTVIIGVHVRLGRLDRSVVEYIREQRAPLDAMPAFLYAVGGHGAFDRNGYARRLTRRTGWVPTSCATFADASARQRPGVRDLACRVSDAVPAVARPSLA